MKITLDSKALLEKAQLLSSIIGNSTLPILENLLIEAEGQELKVTASDLDNTMTTSLKMETPATQNGSICVSGRMLVEMLKAIPNQSITMTAKENNVVDIKTSSGEYSIAYHNGSEFPKAAELQNNNMVLISANTLHKAISKTLFAVSTDDLRPTITGVLFELTTEGAKFVATDTHRLVKYTSEDVVTDEDFSFIMPRKPLNVLKSMLGGNDYQISISFNDTNAEFQLDGYSLICRLIDGKYPNYEAVIPKENPNKIVIDKGDIQGCVKRMSLFSNKERKQIKFQTIDQSLKVSAEDVNFSSKGEETLLCNNEGQDMTIGFNVRFVNEALNNLDCQHVSLEMSLPNRAGILKPLDGLSTNEDLLMLVMPVMLS